MHSEWIGHGEGAEQLSLRTVGLETGNHPRKLGFTPQVECDVAREYGNRM